MKRKFLATAASALLAVTMLSACGTNYKVTFNDYWKKSVTDSSQQTLIETCEYTVGFEAMGSSAFSVDYQNGTYKTTFTSSTIDQKVVYQLKTEFTVQVKYTVNSTSSEWLDDSVTSTVTFQSSGDALKPIKSVKEAVNHSPLSLSPATLTTAYEKYDKTIVTEYFEDCTSGKTIITDNTLTENNKLEKTFSVNHNTYNYLDNEALFFALRCVNTSLTTSTKFNVYDPFVSSTQRISAIFNTATSADFSFALNGETAARNISYYPVNIRLDRSNNTGTTKVAWIAKTTDPYNNTYRNVILRQEMPLAFGLGTLTFSLNSVTFAN